MVRATRYLEIIEEDNLVAHTEVMGEKLIEGLKNVADESKGIMTNVRGKGMMVAFDLPDPDKPRRDDETSGEERPEGPQIRGAGRSASAACWTSPKK